MLVFLYYSSSVPVVGLGQKLLLPTHFSSYSGSLLASTVENIKSEPEENLFTCRYCGALTKEAAIKRSSGQLGITPNNEVYLQITDELLQEFL